MLYAIGDLHLSLRADKPMDVFGTAWDHYENRLRDGFSQLREDDVCVICGDISWGMNLADCREDFRFIHELPGRKIILKGNHDYWWTTATKAYGLCRAEGFTTLDFLHNNSYVVGDIAVCGTRGWFFEEEKGGEHDKKIMNRELMRLEASLKSAPDGLEKVCFLHYPPLYRDYRCEEMMAMLHAYGVRYCYYGHIHGPGQRFAVKGETEGIVFRMVSADYVEFRPVPVKLAGEETEDL